jgi:chemotaxis protein methyltransferase CheR
MPPSSAKGVRIPEGVLALLRDLIHERTGLFFENSRMDLLIEKLQPIVVEGGYSSFLDYYYSLKENKSEEWDRAWAAISVQETYFWREMSQVNALVTVIVPQWFQKHNTPFKIWSAACATGEEPFTIAMALAEAGWSRHPIEIVASDASAAGLEKARSGIFREKSFRALPEALRRKYFSPVKGGWRIAPELAPRVRFQQANLFELGDVSPLARVQVIFCRNVFIYFSPHSIRQTVAMIAAKMQTGGCLFVGASESLLRVTTDFELKEIAGAFAYVRI